MRGVSFEGVAHSVLKNFRSAVRPLGHPLVAHRHVPGRRVVVVGVAKEDKVRREVRRSEIITGL